MTHNERVLELLSDGEPHSHHERYRLHVMGHSRISDLRKQGHVIECWREGDSYLYRLLRQGEDGQAAGVSVSSPSRSQSLPDAGPVTSPEETGPASPYQLSIEEAA